MTEIFDDIRKLYKFRKPCPELSDYIEFFSESCINATKKYTANSPFEVKMFQSWTPTFWLNLGPAYHLYLANKRYHIPSGHAVVVTRNDTATRINHPADHLFTVKFYPGGLEKILGISQSKLSDKMVHLGKLLPPSLIEIIKAQVSIEDRIDIFENFFLQRMNHVVKGDHYLDLVTQTIATYTSSGMKYNINELSCRLFTTSKTINRYFSRVIGITPKTYFETLKARVALTTYMADKKAFIPVDHGYYDTSHFYKAVRNFTGQRMTEQTQ